MSDSKASFPALFLGSVVLVFGLHAVLVSQSAPSFVEAEGANDAYSIFRSTDKDPPLFKELWAVLDASGISQAEQLKKLVELGPSAVQSMYYVRFGRVPVEPKSESNPQSSAPKESARWRELLLRAISRIGAAPALAALERAAEGAPFPRQLLVLEELSELGKAKGIPLFVRIVASLDPISLAAPRFEPVFRATLARLHEADEGTLSALDKEWKRIPPEAQRLTVRALIAVGGPRAITFLFERLTWAEGDVVRVLLVELSRVPPHHLCDVSRTECDLVLGHLRAESDPALMVPAMKLAAALHDYRAVPLLIDLLGADPAIAKDAHDALKLMSGAKFDAKAETWQQWYDAELTWFEECQEQLDQALKSLNAEMILTAVRDVAARPLFRDEFAEALDDLLGSKHAAVRSAVASALGMLRSPRALRALVVALGEDDAALQDAAFRSLLAITNRRHPKNQEAWQTALRLRF